MAYAPALWAQHVVINEIMYAPIKPEPEWIELYNPMDVTVYTTGWTISNHLRTYTILSDSISPKNYLILTKDSANYLRIKYSVPLANILETKMPPLGNTGDILLIKDSLRNTIDSIAYSPSWGGSSDVSLERIDHLAASDSLNFGSCTDSLGATPGAINSIRRRETDLAIESISYTPENQTDLTFTVTLKNKGRKEIQDGTLTLQANSGLPIATAQILTSIPPLASVNVNLSWPNADYGKAFVAAIVNVSNDELHSNDTLYTECYFPVPQNAIVINEIMAVPASGSCQWVEFYNNSPNTANIDSIGLAVRLGQAWYIFFFEDTFKLSPKHYAILSANSNIFSTYPTLENNHAVNFGKNYETIHLKDSGNILVLINSDYSTIDSLHFYPYWDATGAIRPGISLERKRFDAPSYQAANWNSSIDSKGATPLAKNSEVPDTTPATKIVVAEISPNPFSPDGDGFEDIATISLQIPSENEVMINASLYDLRGRLRKTLLENQSAYRTISFPYDGKDNNGITLPIGLYTLVVESVNGLFSPQRKGIVIMKRAR
jgi:hypothetical protein